MRIVVVLLLHVLLFLNVNSVQIETFLKFLNGARVKSLIIHKFNYIYNVNVCVVLCYRIGMCKSVSYSEVLNGQCCLHSDYVAEHLEIIVDKDWTIYGTTGKNVNTL